MGADAMSELPPGFTLDQPLLPEGFTLDRTQRGVMDQLLGATGPRYQTWPERAGRGILSSLGSGSTLSGDVMSGKAQLPSSQGIPGSVPYGDPASAGPRVADMAAFAVPVNPAVRAGDRAIAGSAVKSPVVPTTEELYRVGAADMEGFRRSGLQITPRALKSFAETVRQKLNDAGIHPVDAEKTYAKLDTIAKAEVPEGAYVAASNLKSLRDSFGTTAQNFNPNFAKDQFAATLAIKELDSFIPNVATQDVLAGTPSAASALLERGRGNMAAGYRSNEIVGGLDRAKTGILERAEGRAQAANSGRNLDNTLRQRVEGALEKPKEISGYSDPEIDALNKFVKGGKGRNAARYLSNVLGGGGGFGQAFVGSLGAGGGALAGGAPGAILGAMAPAVTGAALKTVQNRISKKEIERIGELLRTRSPLYEERAAADPVSNLSTVPADVRAGLIRALLGQQSQQQ